MRRENKRIEEIECKLPAISAGMWPSGGGAVAGPHFMCSMRKQIVCPLGCRGEVFAYLVNGDAWVLGLLDARVRY